MTRTIVTMIMISAALIAEDKKKASLPVVAEQLAYRRAEVQLLRSAAEFHRLRAELLTLQQRLNAEQEKLLSIRREAETKAGCPLDEALAKCATYGDKEKKQ